MQGECHVCLQECSSSLAPCGHTLCAACARKWFARSPTCPYCRTTPVAMPDHDPNNDEWLVDVPPDTHLGLTLGSDNMGVRVLRLTRWDRAHRSGLRVGDVVTHVNGIEVRTDKAAISVMNCAVKHTARVYLALARPRRRWWCL